MKKVTAASPVAIKFREELFGKYAVEGAISPETFPQIVEDLGLNVAQDVFVVNNSV